MSPRAACRLELLGLDAVYDYTGGKSDWLAAGLGTEGPGANTPRPGRLARTDVPTCTLTETLAAAKARVEPSGEALCVVVSDSGIVLGVLDPEALSERADEEAAGDVMRTGPATVRANEDLAGLVARMHDRHVSSIVVTDPDGRLIGNLDRDDCDAALGATAPQREEQ